MKLGARVLGDFQYDAELAVENPGSSDTPTERKSKSEQSRNDTTITEKPNGVSSQESEKASEKEPFALRDIDLSIPRGTRRRLRDLDCADCTGALVCIVGRVGSGKSALFMGMINEMRRLRGEVSFGGTVSFVPQQAWVQSGTVRDNITFSTDLGSVDEARVKEVIQATGLQADLDMWQDGDM